MKKFIALYMAPIEEFDKIMKSTPEEMKKGMDDWNKWADSHKENIADLGAPLGKNKRVTKDGVSSTRNEIGGFSIIQAESHEVAADIFKDSPHLTIPGAYIDVLEWVQMPGM